MTVLSLRWSVARPLRRATVIRNAVIRNAVIRNAVIRNLGTARRERRPYRDPFFADPAAVEDDSRRMGRRDTAAR